MRPIAILMLLAGTAAADGHGFASTELVGMLDHTWGGSVGYAAENVAVRLEVDHLRAGFDPAMAPRNSDGDLIASVGPAWQVGAAVAVFPLPARREAYVEAGMFERSYDVTSNYFWSPSGFVTDHARAWSERLMVGWMQRAEHHLMFSAAAGVTRADVGLDQTGTTRTFYTPTLELRAGFVL